MYVKNKTVWVNVSGELWKLWKLKRYTVCVFPPCTVFPLTGLWPLMYNAYSVCLAYCNPPPPSPASFIYGVFAHATLCVVCVMCTSICQVYNCLSDSANLVVRAPDSHEWRRTIYASKLWLSFASMMLYVPWTGLLCPMPGIIWDG